MSGHDRMGNPKNFKNFKSVHLILVYILIVKFLGNQIVFFHH